MTKEQAIEKAAKALMKRQGYQEDNWRMTGSIPDKAEDIVVVLAAFGLIEIDK